MNLPSAAPPLGAPHLADSTVWSKVRTRGRPDLAQWFNDAVRADSILTCDAVVLELLRSAPNGDAFTRQAALLALLPACPLGERQFRRARDVQTKLAARAYHRGIPPVDLLIAAAAETAGVPLLHYDHDFDLIAAVTGQESHWLLPAGSLP